MKKIYLILAIIGIIIPYYFVWMFIIENWLNIALFSQEIFATFPAGNFASDLVISIIVFLLFLSQNIKKYKVMPNMWVFVWICSFVWLSCAFPLFLYYRERSLER